MNIVTTTSVFPIGTDHFHIVDRLAKIGYTALDMAFDYCELGDAGFMSDGYESWALRLREHAETQGLRFTQSHASFDADAEGDIVERNLRCAQILGIPYMVVHPVFPFGTQEPEEKAAETFAINVQFFRALMPEARACGVTVCLENMPFHYHSLSRPADILRVIAAVDDPHFAMCFDTGHVGVFPEPDLYEEVLRVKDVLRVLHVHDNDGKTDLHQLPLFGKLGFAGFARALREIGFEGVFSFETAPPRDLSPALFEKVLGLMPQLARDIVEME